MNILYVTTSYDQNKSSATVRNNGLVSGFLSLGHKVTVLTVDWPQSIKSKYFSTINSEARIIRTKIAVLRLIPSTESKTTVKPDVITKLRHLIRDIIFFPDVCAGWPNNIPAIEFSNYSILISSSDFKSSHFVGMRIKQRNPHLKWIQIWGDPWRDDTNLSWVHKIRAKWHEHKLLNKADIIVYVSELTKNRISMIYPSLKTKLFHIPRSFYKVSPKKDTDKNYWEMLYTGVLSIGRNISSLLKAIELFNEKNSKPIKLSLYGEYSNLQKFEIEKYKFVEIHESIEFRDVMELYKEADIALLISNNSNSTQIPGKLYDYMGTNLPVLCLVNNLTDQICGTLSYFDRCVISKNEENDILNKLEYITQNYKLYNYDMEFSPSAIASRFISLINNN